MSLEKFAKVSHSKAAAAILLAKRKSTALTHDEEASELAIAALVAVSMPQICLALEDAIKLIRQWHGMGMSKRDEQIAWNIYRENAPEMKSITFALKTALGEVEQKRGRA